MQLTLHQLLPLPLRGKPLPGQMGIWKVDLVFQQGEYVFVQAPSGTGKTTLVHLLYGLRTDYEGDVSWGANNLRDLSATSVASLRAREISVVFQDMKLFPDLTAWENLNIKRLLTNSVTEEKMSDWLQRLGIEDKKDALAATLSYGEQQRVSIIRALLQPFQWLLMDEPFSHLDHANTLKAISLILEEIRERKAGLLLADLDDNDYFPYSQKILL